MHQDKKEGVNNKITADDENGACRVPRTEA